MLDAPRDTGGGSCGHGSAGAHVMFTVRYRGVDVGRPSWRHADRRSPARTRGSRASVGPATTPSIGSAAPPVDLLRSSGATVPAPAPAPHRALALAALLAPSHTPRPPSRRRPLGGAGVRAGGRTRPRPSGPHRESSRAGGVVRPRGVPRPGVVHDPGEPIAPGPLRLAYAVRWLELGDGVAPPAMDKSRHRARLTRPRSRARYPSRMRLSHLFFTTLRDDPADAEMPSHRLLLRAGYVRQLGSGIYSLLPLGFRVNKRVEQVIREEMDRIGGQEMEMPVVHPADIWQASGRYDAIGPELTRFKDRNGRDMVLAMTHEEVVGLLLADIVQSYRQLPMMVYHFQTKWRDEPRARGGLIRVREFVMKDAYSCDRDAGRPRRQLRGAARRLRPDLRAARPRDRRGLVGRRDHGRQPGPRVHGPQPGRRGRPRPVRGVRLRRQPAGRGHAQAGAARAERRRCPLEEVATPGTTTIASLAAFLGIGAGADGQGRLLRDRRRPARDRHRPRRLRGQRDQARQRGQGRRRDPPGPGRGDQGGRDGARLRLADRGARTRSSSSTTSSPRSPNLVAGANREGFHYRNVNVGRDFTRGRRGRHHQRPGGRRLPDLRRSRSSCATASRSATSSSSGRSSPTRPARPTSARTARPTRSSWARTGSASGATWPASSRRTTTRRASSGRPRSRPTPPTSSRSGRRRSRGSTEVAERLHELALDGRPRDPVGRPRRVARASSSPTPSCSACPGS